MTKAEACHRVFCYSHGTRRSRGSLSAAKDRSNSKPITISRSVLCARTALRFYLDALDVGHAFLSSSQSRPPPSGRCYLMSALMESQSSSSSTASQSPGPSRPALPMRSYTHSNPIDLTLDDDDDDGDDEEISMNDRKLKRSCSHSRSFNASASPLSEDSTHSYPLDSSGLSPAMSASTLHPAFGPPPGAPSPHWRYPQSNQPIQLPIPNTIQRPPPFTGPSNSSAFFQHRLRPAVMSSSQTQVAESSHSHSGAPSNAMTRQVIDLTSSPSPPPVMSRPQLSSQGNMPSDLPPKTPVCIGQLTVTALVLYPIPYLLPQEHLVDTEWAPVRLTYEHTPHKLGGQETIHIKTPNAKSPTGELLQGENFGVVEQKVATYLGPMLGKGLIRLDAKVRKGMPNVSRTPMVSRLTSPGSSSFPFCPCK